MKKGKNALIIFIFLILALLLLVILVPAAMKNNEVENLNNEENSNLQVEENVNTDNSINTDNPIIGEDVVGEEVFNVESGATLEEERELEIGRRINDYAPIKTNEDSDVEIVSIEWTGENKALVEYKDTETYFAEFEFSPNTPIITLSTQIVQEEE